MFDKLLSIVAPHYCCICAKVGSLLCNSCIYNITDEPYSLCVWCSALSHDGVCRNCQKPSQFSKAWVTGERTDELKQLLNRLKFHRTYAAAGACAELLHHTLPSLPSNTIVVSVPTIPKHIRIRGYDHAERIACQFASKRKLSYKKALYRNNHTIQLGASASLRKKQAATAFSCSVKLEVATPYLIIDDIITTGSTLQATASTLRQQGAEIVWVAAVLRQPLLKSI